MNHKNTLVFVSTGETTTILKVGEKPVASVIEIDFSKATVLTEDRQSIPANEFKDFDQIKPYLRLAV